MWDKLWDKSSKVWDKRGCIVTPILYNCGIGLNQPDLVNQANK